MFLSKSKIMTYLSCPAQYKKSYIDKIEIKPNIYMLRGTAIHEFAEYFWKNVKIEGDKLIIPIIKDHHDKKVNMMIDNMVKLEQKRWRMCLKHNKRECFIPLWTEKQLQNDELKLRGIIDRLGKDFDNQLYVMELKSNSACKLNWGLVFELNFYKYLIENTVELDRPLDDGLVYFPTDNSFVNLKLDKVDWVKKQIMKVKEGIAMGEFSHNPCCQYCDCDIGIKGKFT